MLGEFYFGEIPFTDGFYQTIFAYMDFLRARGGWAIPSSSRARGWRTVAIGHLKRDQNDSKKRIIPSPAIKGSRTRTIAIDELTIGRKIATQSRTLSGVGPWHCRWGRNDILRKFLFDSLRTASMNSTEMTNDSRKASCIKLQEDFNLNSTKKSRKPRKTRCPVLENCLSCLNTASWRNKARIFELHLCSTDPCSLWATMFHGQRVLSARPKPCCRLAVF